MQWGWVKWFIEGSLELLQVRKQLTWTVAHLVVPTLHWSIFTLPLQNLSNMSMLFARILLMGQLDPPFQKYLVNNSNSHANVGSGGFNVREIKLC